MDVRSAFGGNPVAVVLRLALISLVVGIVLAALGIDISNFFYRMSSLIRELLDFGIRSIDWILQYMLLGAMVVVPIWLITRIAAGARGKQE